MAAHHLLFLCFVIFSRHFDVQNTQVDAVRSYMDILTIFTYVTYHTSVRQKSLGERRMDETR